MQATQAMPQQDPLAQLKDIHPPAEVDWWPLDWGWWLLTLILLSSIIGLVIYWRRKRAFNRPRREARQLLTLIKSTDENWPMQINEVLKRTALCYFSHEEVAKLYGNSWRQFMLHHIADKHNKKLAAGLNTLQTQLYAPLKDNTHFETCIEAADLWLRYGLFTPTSTAPTHTSRAKETSHA